MAVVLTRPLQESLRWAALLREQGVPTIVLPLLAIGPAPRPEALAAAAATADGHAAVMFVSANAAQAFFAAGPAFRRARAWAPGPGTRDVLLAAGVAASRIDAPAADAQQFDSEHLWQQVQGQLRRGDRLLLVRGGDADGRSEGREWLGGQLSAAGVHVDTVVAYTRQAPDWDDGQRQAAQRAAVDGSRWLFTSSEAVQQLRVLLPAQGWGSARALATHPRIADAVRALGFAQVVSTRPSFADVLASIESDR